MTRRSRSRWFARVAAVVVVGVLCSSLSASAGEAPNQVPAAGNPDPGPGGYVIRLQSRAFKPAAGRHDPAGVRAQKEGTRAGRVHFLIQFDGLASEEAAAAVRDSGGRIVSFVTGTTYVASAKPDAVADIAGVPGVRWLGPIETRDKLAPDVADGRFRPWAKKKDGTVGLTIQGHADVSLTELEQLVEALGGEVVDRVRSLPSVTAVVETRLARVVARQDIVLHVSSVDLPLRATNDTARQVLNVNPAAAAPFGLTGLGITALVYDAGIVDSHPDFGARILTTDPGQYVGHHATHVAGTLGGNGAGSNAATSGDATNLAAASVIGATRIKVASNSAWRGNLNNPTTSDYGRSGTLVVIGSGPSQEVAVLDRAVRLTVAGVTNDYLVFKGSLTKAHANAIAVTGRNPGAANQWQGVAPSVRIRSFSSTGGAADFFGGGGGDLEVDFTTALGNSSGVDLATMSLANNVYKQNPPPCANLGAYGSTAQLVDKIVRGSLNDPAGQKQKLIFLEAAGNERSGAAPCGQNDTIASPATAKNSIAVGAINSDDLDVSSFSSLGPTDDGRVKPDVVAPGCSSGGATMRSPDFIDQVAAGAAAANGQLDPGEVRNAYGTQCGTSMATPAAAGVASLVLQEWKRSNSIDRPANHTMKAILVHTATKPASTASRRANLNGANNDLYIRATAAGTAGANQSIQLNNLGANQVLAVAGGNPVAVTLATDAAGDVVSTAAEVVAKINSTAGVTLSAALTARDLDFDAAGNASDRGVNDGSGVVEPTVVVAIPGGVNALVGPDYRYGWGLVDAKAATDLVRANAKTEQIDVSRLAVTNEQKVYRTYSNGVNDMKVTLAWDDLPTSPLVAPGAATPALVNDLDLSLVPPGGGAPCLPYKLNPATPAAAAGTGVDSVNNVEVVSCPKAVGIWEIRVVARSIAAGSDQEFTVIKPPPGNSVTVTPSVTIEGDSGTSKASFVVALAHADDEEVKLNYTTVGASASAADFVATSGSLTFAPGEIEKLVEVEITGDIDVEGDERFTLDVSYQGGALIASGIGTIVNDDGTRTFTVVGKTGDASGGLTLTGIQHATVNINDKGKVVFVGRTTANSFGQMGLWTGKSGESPVLVNPSWASNDRRIFDHPTIRNDGSIVAYDRQSGSPPNWYIREWTAPLLFGGWNQSVLAASGGQFDSVLTPNASIENGYLTFVGLAGSAYVQWGADGADGTWGNVQAPAPVIANNGATVFRQVAKDANGALDYLNAPLRVVNVYGSGSGQVTCSGASGCPHPNFTNIGWRPGISHDGNVVAFYGEQATSTSPETGIWASVRGASGGRTLVRIAKIGDAGITGFADADQDERLGVNATQEDLKLVTVVFRATSEGGRMALYRARVVFEGPAGAPTGYHVDGPSLVVRRGDTIAGVGAVDSFSIGNRPINNRNTGEIAFQVTAGAVEAAVVAEADDAPVIVVPGIAGSEIYDIQRNESVWFFPPPLSFLSRDSYWSTALSMREEDQHGRNIVPTDALRTTFGLSVYKNMLNKLVGSGYREYVLGPRGENVRTCDTNQIGARPNLFVFPYDWRRSNAVNAALLKNYMACVKRFYPNTKVNVLTHSMGGLLARRAIISQPGFADNVNTLFSVAPPWLGAPKLIYVLRSGDFVSKPIPFAVGPGVRRAAEALPGAHQLMPSAEYFRLAGTPYGESGRDFDGDGNDGTIYATFDAVKTLLDRKYPRFKPGSTAAAFHGFAGQDDWSADTYSFKFVEIYGEQSTAKTIGGVYETTKVICEMAAASVPGSVDPERTCSTSHPMMLTWTMGDGTVPTVSAARTTAMQPSDAQIIPFLQSASGGSDNDYDHNGILGNDTVLQRIVDILAENGGPPDPNAPAPLTASTESTPEAAPAQEPPAASSLRMSFTEQAIEPSAIEPAAVTAVVAPAAISSIAVYGAAGFVAKDDAGNSTEPAVDPSGNVAITPIPDVDVYAVADDARLLRSTSAAPLTVTFEAAGPVEVELRTENAAGTVTEATRYLDVGVPDGTPIELTAQAGAAPSLRYDGDGNGSYEGLVAVDVQLTGAAAADVTPPTVDVQRSLAADEMLDVSIVATDAGSGLRSVLYSLDGETFKPYTGPFRVDPTTDLRLSAIAQDNAGNRRATDEIVVGKGAANRPLAESASASTAEDTAVDVDLPGSSTGGSTLRYAIKSAPGSGTVTMVGSRVRYTPALDFNGVDTFTYVVDDGLLRSAPGTVTITVDPVNDAPRVSIVGPATVAEGAVAVAYRADAVDPEGDQVTMVWSITGASLDAAGADAELTVGDGPATATIAVETTDVNGAATTVQRVLTIQNVNPATLPGGPRSGPWGVPILFSGLVTDPSAADTAAGFAMRWSFGDKTPDATGSSVSHVYANPGSYTATFFATDKDGGTGSGPSGVSVLKRNTTLAYTGSTGTVAYGYAQISAKLTDAVNAGTAKLSGKRITFTVGLQALTATTDATGAATVVLASPLGPGTYTVSTRFTGDTMYNGSSAASASLKVASSVGSATGSQLVALSNGARASFDVSSMDASTVRGTLEYIVGATTIRSTSLTPMGIASDGRSAWFAGVSTSGQLLRAYVEDGGAGPAADRFKFWVSGVLQTGDGRLSAGEVTIVRP